MTINRIYKAPLHNIFKLWAKIVVDANIFAYFFCHNSTIFSHFRWNIAGSLRRLLSIDWAWEMLVKRLWRLLFVYDILDNGHIMYYWGGECDPPVSLRLLAWSSSPSRRGWVPTPSLPLSLPLGGVVSTSSYGRGRRGGRLASSPSASVSAPGKLITYN